MGNWLTGSYWVFLVAVFNGVLGLGGFRVGLLVMVFVLLALCEVIIFRMIEVARAF